MSGIGITRLVIGLFTSSPANQQVSPAQ